MRRKLIFIGILILVLVLTTGTFAYTFSNNTVTTLSATLADDGWTTYQPSASQPDWNSLLPSGEYNSEILVPNAPGDDTELSSQYPEADEHWDKVDDQPAADDGDTYVSTEGSGGWQRDLYNLSNFTGAGGETTIENITVYFRFAADDDYDVTAMAAIKTDGKVYEGPNMTQSGTDFITQSWQCTKNPATDKSWTPEEINDLQAGITIKGQNKNKPALCTQVYVKVNYKHTTTQGELPNGNLFDIIPHEDYSGDLQVRIYLTNIANLLKAYNYLNMELYMANSLEAKKTPHYQILSIENGVVSFNIEGGSAKQYTVELSGGSYRLVSDNTDEWGAGWSIVPEFYCEVTQR
jgi:hypothetical protein